MESKIQIGIEIHTSHFVTANQRNDKKGRLWDRLLFVISLMIYRGIISLFENQNLEIQEHKNLWDFGADL